MPPGRPPRRKIYDLSRHGPDCPRKTPTSGVRPRADPAGCRPAAATFAILGFPAGPAQLEMARPNPAMPLGPGCNSPRADWYSSQIHSAWPTALGGPTPLERHHRSASTHRNPSTRSSDHSVATTFAAASAATVPSTTVSASEVQAKPLASAHSRTASTARRTAGWLARRSWRTLSFEAVAGDVIDPSSEPGMTLTVVRPGSPAIPVRP